MKKDWTREELEKHYVGKMTAVTIAVNQKFSGVHRILDMSELRKLLEESEIIAKEECYCRKKMGNCIEPMDGCLSLDEEAEMAIEKDNAKRISVDEAMAAMQRTYDAGFVHMAYTDEGKDKVGIICSCCTCCCHSLSAALRFGYPDHVFSSNYVAKHDSDLCNDCGICVERCQFGARELTEKGLEYEKEKCFGCGLCLKYCTEGAIEMVERV
jgi:NAD-dependent dihydropyrimidine dehydrogenase PreA subunit